MIPIMFATISNYAGETVSNGFSSLMKGNKAIATFSSGVAILNYQWSVVKMPHLIHSACEKMIQDVNSQAPLFLRTFNWISSTWFISEISAVNCTASITESQAKYNAVSSFFTTAISLYAIKYLFQHTYQWKYPEQKPPSPAVQQIEKKEPPLLLLPPKPEPPKVVQDLPKVIIEEVVTPPDQPIVEAPKEISMEPSRDPIGAALCTYWNWFA